MAYIDEIRSRNLELAAESLLMAAMLIEVTQAEAYAPIYVRLAFAPA